MFSDGISTIVTITLINITVISMNTIVITIIITVILYIYIYILVFGWHYLSNATCLMRTRLFLRHRLSNTAD